MSGSPYKKPQSSTQLAKNRLASVSNPVHTSEEVERLKVIIFEFICSTILLGTNDSFFNCIVKEKKRYCVFFIADD